MINFKKELITPTLAKQLLEANINNRPLKGYLVSQYANDIINKRWKDDTAEMIKISKTNIILDGQHRLHAIIKANIPVYFHVATNLEDEIFDVLDTGSTRNACDVFKINGITRYNAIPSIISFYNTLKENNKKGARKKIRGTNAVLLDQYMQQDKYWDNVSRLSHNWYLAFAKILPGSQIGGYYSYFEQLNSEKAFDFIDKLCTGMNIDNDVISILRNKLLSDKMSLKKIPPTLKMAFIIKSWNAYVKGTNFKILKYDAATEEFPTAVGNLF
jgi:hypothetical protein